MANKLCKYCRTQIDFEAKVCPNCGKKLTMDPIAKIFIIIGLILAATVGSTILSSVRKGYKDAEEKNKIKKEAAKYSQSEYKDACQAVSYDKIARDKDCLKFEKVTFTGKVVQATSELCRMNVTKDEYGIYSDTIAFVTEEIDEKILEGDIVTIWGGSLGSYTYKAVLGNEVTVPRIYAIYIENHGKSNAEK